MTPILEDVKELINRRRRQIHVHSVLYYHMHTNLVPDAIFDGWTADLLKAQQAYPKVASNPETYLPDVFKGWTGDTGMHLPPLPNVVATAKALLATKKRRYQYDE